MLGAMQVPPLRHPPPEHMATYIREKNIIKTAYKALGPRAVYKSRNWIAF